MNNVTMSGMPNMGGPVGGGIPMMNNGVAGGAARHSTNSPGRNDAEDGDDSKDDIDSKRPNDLPLPNLPKECPESCFLYEWFCLFWDMFNAQRGKGDARNVLSYVSTHRATPAQLRNINPMHAGAAYARMGPGSGGPSAQQLQQMQQMQIQKQAMQREPSDGNHPQRAQSPGSAENAPSPSKRPRLDGPAFNGQQGGMATSGRGQSTGMPAQQFPGFQGQNPAHKNLQAYQATLSQHQQKQMPNAAAGGPPNQGSPMMAQGADANAVAANSYGCEIGQNGATWPGGQQGGQGNHALQDYQMQLMLLEQQNKKRLMLARQEQDAIRPDGKEVPAALWTRSVNSPNPSEQMKRGTPHMNNPGIPSPLPEGQNRGSPSTMTSHGTGGQMDAGMAPQFYKIEDDDGTPTTGLIGKTGPNGGAPWLPTLLKAPTSYGYTSTTKHAATRSSCNANANGRTQPPSPQGSTAALPHLNNQTRQILRRENETKETKTKKGSAANLAAGATPSADPSQDAATPAPATPITPVHTKTFNNGSNPNGAVQPVNVSQMNDPQFDMLEFQNPMGGNTDVLTDFDFDTFLNDTNAATDDFSFDPSSFLGDNEISETV
ncbi:hypothetical protein DID88_003292 [Monilinia fructigena]|uniref:LisH domain-containing protein n=1 Tax=Monilinia fructigena TaxID=38457 RepID=A0A395IW54_9HELO|nr:hypothetical protein DID88_003292 [Monilinia fructigena]